MEKFEILVSIAATAIPLIGTVLACVVKLAKSVKLGKEERKCRLWAEFAQEAVKYVEVLKGKSNGELTGETKKEIAMNKIEAACIKNGISFDKDKVGTLIENIIDLTKRINRRDKDNLIPVI